MDYFELRKIVSKIVPRLSVFLRDENHRKSLIKEKGRKSNYHQFNLESGEMIKRERLLNLEEMQSFIEVSLRSQACPMSLNVDVYDSKRCHYGCRYCVIGDTLIDTPEGKKAIKDLKEGDHVLTVNEETRNLETKAIRGTMNRIDNIYELKVGNKVLRITGEHPVYTRKGWVKVHDLTIDDEVLTFD